MPHPLEIQYDLTATELLDAIDRRFRLTVALEGAVAEVHFERKLKVATQEGWLATYEGHDLDGMPDFTGRTLVGRELRVEVKTIRNSTKPQVELQKTRASKSDASSRYYDRHHFDVVAVCMGRKTGRWSQFLYALVRELPENRKYANKLQVMHGLGTSTLQGTRWFGRFQDVIDAFD